MGELPSIKAGAQGSCVPPSPRYTSLASCSSFLCLLCSCSWSKFITKRKKYFLALHFCLHFICISCSPSFLCKNVFVMVLLPCKNDFVVRYCPQERFYGVLSPTRTIFVRGNHALQGLLTLGRLTLIFINSHIILMNFGCVCCACDFRYEECREEVHEHV